MARRRIFTEDEKENFVKVCNESPTVAEACRRLNMKYKTVRFYAKELGCFCPNSGGRGTNKPKKVGKGKYDLNDIFNGLYPTYSTNKLKHRMIDECVIEDKCAICGWNKKRNPEDKYTPCELHHINGDEFDHRIENLILLCPNCHSLTDNHRGRNKRLSTQNNESAE